MSRPRSRSRRTRHCSRCCARTWGSRERSTAVSSANAVPAPCCWTVRPSCRAWSSVSPARGTRCARWKAWRWVGNCTRCRRRPMTSARRSADTATGHACSRQKSCCSPTPSPRATKSRTHSPATSAAAPATSRSTRPSSWQRRACAARKPSRRGKRCMAARSIIGKALRKVDAVAKVTGATRFADDLTLPRMLYCKLLRSTQPHARIVAIDTTAAEALEGVHAVLTGRALPIPFGILPVSQDEHALCLEKVRFIGDPVAAVAAVSEEIATAALDLIKVVYEPLTPITSAEDAVAHPEPRIHDYGDGGNLH